MDENIKIPMPIRSAGQPVMFSPAIFLAAIGITTLELSEASAVGMALYADSGSSLVFLVLSSGVLAILVPTAVVGNFITLFPLVFVRAFSATLLLYFGLRLTRSARRSVRYDLLGPSSKTASHAQNNAKHGILATAFSVGAVEAFEAAIVIVALLPNGYVSTLDGVFAGTLVVVVASYALRSRVRKVKQASVKVAVSALLLTFAVFWYFESVATLSDLLLVPLFLGFLLIVYYISHRGLEDAAASPAA